MTLTPEARTAARRWLRICRARLDATRRDDRTITAAQRQRAALANATTRSKETTR